MSGPAPADLAAMKKDTNVTVLEQPGLNVAYLAYNTQKAPLGDVRVRKALNLAINKKALVETLYGATAIPAIGPIPPALWSYNKGLRD
jgi:dipeptide transport system substrate-binding protein